MRSDILLLALVVTLMGAAALHTLTSIHQDIGRHLTLGRIIWETRLVPDTNLFSYTAPDFPFVNHHWLAEVVLFLGERAFGLEGWIVVKALLVSAALALALAAAFRPQAVLWSALAGVIAVFILVERTDVRPEIFSFLFFAWYLFVLFRYSYFDIRTSERLLWTLPIIQLLWVNTHIYFFFGPLAYACFLLGKWANHHEAPVSRTHLALGIVLLAVNLVNPFGLAGALYPLNVFDNYGYSIVENKSPFFLRDFGYPPATSVALGLGATLFAASFAANIRNIRQNIFGLLLGAACLTAALIMIRNFPLFALAMVPAVTKNFFAIARSPSSGRAVAGMIAVVMLIGGMVSNEIPERWRLGRRFGIEVPRGTQGAVDFIRVHNLKGPLFNNFDVGSFLIWRLPEEPVFIDGRPEAYPADFIQDVYIRMQEDQKLWERLSAQYGFHFVFWDERDITPWSRQFLARLERDRSWVLVYRQNGVVIFVKDLPEHREVIRRFRIAP